MMAVTPAYVEISDRIGEQIRSGKLQAGTRVPGEREIQERHGVSSTVARAVIARLRSQGLIISQQGKGSFVAPQPEPIISIRDGRDVRAEGDDRLLTAHRAEIDASQDVAKSLGLTTGDRITQVLYRWTVNSDVVEISEYYEPHHFSASTKGRPAIGNSPAETDVIERFKSIGVAVTRVQEMTSARMPTPEEAHLMSLPPGVPVLAIQRIHYRQDTPLALTRSVLRGDLFVLKTDQEIAAQ